MIVNDDDLKAHSNLLAVEDMQFLQQKIGAAQDHVERWLGFKIEERYPGDTVPPSLKEAVLQLAAHYYENREAALVGVNAQALPFGVKDIVDSYRDWTF